MKKRNKLIALFVILLAAVLLLTACGANALETAKKRKNTATPLITETPAPEVTEKPGPLDEAQRLADYIFEHGELPDNFLTKKEAKALGWQTKYRYVSDAAPGMSIGGDWFGNYEKQLPVIKGREYYEADCYYQGGPRNKYRIVYSNDGHVWYTEHYKTFEELFPSKEESE